MKGSISIPIATVGVLLVSLVTGLAAYFGTVNAQSQKVADVKDILKEDISIDRQRITAVETNIKTILDNQKQQSKDIKEILNRLPR